MLLPCSSQGPYSRTIKLRYIVGFGLVEMAISTNSKPAMYRNFYENVGPGVLQVMCLKEL